MGRVALVVVVGRALLRLDQVVLARVPGKAVTDFVAEVVAAVGALRWHLVRVDAVGAAAAVAGRLAVPGS